MNPTVSLVFAHADPNAVTLKINDLIDLLNVLNTVEIQGSYIPYILSSDTPGVEDNDKAWIKTDSNGRPLEVRTYYNGLWRRVYNGMMGEIRGYTGNPGTDFDSNGLGVVGGTYDGWHICNGKDGTPDLSDRFLIAAHMNNQDVNGYQGGQWVTTEVHTAGEHTGGFREITLDATNTYRPARGTIDAARFTADGNTPDPGGDLLGTGGGGTRYDIHNGEADAGNPTPPPINIINPFIAMAYIIFVGYT